MAWRSSHRTVCQRGEGCARRCCCTNSPMSRNAATPPISPALRARRRRWSMKPERRRRRRYSGKRFRPRLADRGGGPRAYSEAGHYYTVYYLLLAAGAQTSDAAEMAFYCQMPDQVIEFDALNAGYDYLARVADNTPGDYLKMDDRIVPGASFERDIDIEKGLHCLTGGQFRAGDELSRRQPDQARFRHDRFWYRPAFLRRQLCPPTNQQRCSYVRSTNRTRCRDNPDLAWLQ